MLYSIMEASVSHPIMRFYRCRNSYKSVIIPHRFPWLLAVIVASMKPSLMQMNSVGDIEHALVDGPYDILTKDLRIAFNTIIKDRLHYALATKVTRISRENIDKDEDIDELQLLAEINVQPSVEKEESIREEGGGGGGNKGRGRRGGGR